MSAASRTSSYERCRCVSHREQRTTNLIERAVITGHISVSAVSLSVTERYPHEQTVAVFLLFVSPLCKVNQNSVDLQDGSDPNKDLQSRFIVFVNYTMARNLYSYLYPYLSHHFRIARSTRYALHQTYPELHETCKPAPTSSHTGWSPSPPPLSPLSPSKNKTAQSAPKPSQMPSSSPAPTSSTKSASSTGSDCPVRTAALPAAVSSSACPLPSPFTPLREGRKWSMVLCALLGWQLIDRGKLSFLGCRGRRRRRWRGQLLGWRGI